MLPANDKNTAMATWWQNLLNTLHTLSQWTCELPLYPIRPIELFAPTAEKSNATIAKSKIIIINEASLFLPLVASITIKEVAAYAQEIAFAITKYL